MTARTLTSATIDRYLKLIRRPADMVIARLPGQRTGLGPAARLIVDRLDAAVRTGLAATLSDDTLRTDARRREAAADERERALELRREAGRRTKKAETRVQDTQAEATSRRERASAAAGERRRRASEKKQARTQQAAKAEQSRTEASREQEATAADRIEAETAEAMLPAVEEQAQALNGQEVAAEQSEEARRLAEAAARVKAERKQENGSGSL